MMLLLLLCLETDPVFKTLQVLEPIPSESELYLRKVDDVAVAPDGRTFVLDPGSVCIHVWNADGHYLQSFGRQGQGPGEFNFRNNSNALAFKANTLYVLDSETGKISMFDEEGTYMHAFTLDVGRRIMPLFAVPDSETLLIHNANWQGAFQRLATYDANGGLKRKLNQIDDKTWRYVTENGERKVTLIIYATSMITGYDDVGGEVLVGDNATNKVQISDLNGKPLRELSLELTRREMTQEIMRDWKEDPWYKQQSFYKLDFPDRLPTFNQIISFNEGFLFFLQTTFERHIQGIVTDKEGKTLRRFDTVLGNGGGLYGSNGALFTVRADDMGDLSIRRVSAEQP